MIQDIVIRAEFLIEDLNKAIIKDDIFHKHIVKAWQEDIRYLIENGVNGGAEMIYDFNNQDDLIECIKMGMSAEDIAYLVEQYRNNNDCTQFFTYINEPSMYGCHIFCKQDIINEIQSKITQIAYNTLKYPYNDIYAELYREFVVPMIKGQI